MWTEEQITKIANKCADGIEFGQNFGKYSRLKKFQYAIIIDEKKNSEGASYVLKKKKNQKERFVARILRPKTEGLLLALWKKGKISFISHSQNNSHNVEIKSI
ncbi:hypothetical protein CMESO_52 (nucleomorph) [Chroomonas mesostigmatica CCMP1168]|uniref:Uncharacterized protein n=1 Tax=Chroomonas mesostigmatica CCMP1168 TaxID=1195612 RepID=J7G2L2_9CRYP|nr:hypothetical protein CMESO_52 [Chroomonas mesostigmatica CCMP1168]|mmetsp:Transcript_66791/g.164621  ORF Transcript_66791/g.164621 Transcript_66791/m.164621 type:complete len:103 (-) Transcript_66791:3027-3335(-)